MERKEDIAGTTFELRGDDELVATRTFDAPPHVVWSAHVEPELLKQWMLEAGSSMTRCEVDLRPGGAWHFAWREVDGSEMHMRGVYKTIVEHERLVNTENWGRDWPEALNTMTLTEEGGRTRVETVVTYPNAEARDRAVNTGMPKGWAEAWQRLDQQLAVAAT